MADTKITALTALTAADPINDVIPIVDVSDTSMAASGTTKKISVNNILSSSPTASGALTVTGLVTAGSASITGDLTVDTSTLKVDSANDAVGIGTTSPTTYGAKLAVFGSGNGILAVGNATSYTTLQSNGNDFYLNMKGVGSTIFRLGSGDTESMRLNPTGNLVLKGGTITANGVGVTFPAVQVASSDANCLDDYEEGTWTGTLKGSVSNPTVAVTATGKYTKVGRQVTVNINYNNVSTVGASGNVTIDGLPFIGADNFAGSSIAFDLFAISTTLASWNAGTEIEFFITGAYVKATHNPGTGRYLTTTITYNA